MKKQYLWENNILMMMNDYKVWELTCKPLLEAYELEDKLWEMEYRDNKLIEVDDGFPIDFN